MCLLCGTNWILKYNSGYFFSEAAPRLWAGIRRVLTDRPAFDSRYVHAVNVVNKVALTRVFVRVLRLSLSILFHQRSKLIFIYMLFLPGGQTSEAWSLSSSALLEIDGQKWIEKCRPVLFFVLFLSPLLVPIIPPMPHAHIHAIVIRRANGEVCEASNQAMFFRRKCFVPYFVV